MLEINIRISTISVGCQILKHRVTIPCKGLSISHEIRMKSGGFHEIRQISGEIWQISWNPVDFRWNPTPNLVKIRRVFAETSASDFWNIWFHLKSAGFHEICQTSWWNPLDFMDFMKSAGFHGEIHQISWWNLPDFMVKSTRFHGEICQISWMWAFGWWSSIGLSIGLQFLARGLLISHEICQILWNLHEICWISGEIHPKPYKIRCFSKNSSDWSFEKQKTYTWSSHKSS